MQTWEISLPSEAEVFLRALKTLALFEFIPTEKILAMVNLVCDKNEIDPCACDKQSNLGNLVSNMGIMLIFGFLGLILLTIILVLSIAGRKSTRIKALIQKLR